MLGADKEGDVKLFEVYDTVSIKVGAFRGNWYRYLKLQKENGYEPGEMMEFRIVLKRG